MLLLAKRSFARAGEKMCYYKVLNVPVTATTDAIKASYYQLAKKLHPDTLSSVRNQKELFIRVSEAYTILSDPIKRSKYNTSIQLQIEEENRLQAITNILYPPKIIKVYDTFDDYYKSMQKHKDKYGKRNLKTMY